MIVDASVAHMWLVREDQSAKAETLIPRLGMAAPDIIDVELDQALTRRVRQRLLQPSDVKRLWPEVLNLPLARASWREFADDALALSLHLRATFNDCLYLAMAIAEDAPLVTADQRFVRSVVADRRLRDVVVGVADL